MWEHPLQRRKQLFSLSNTMGSGSPITTMASSTAPIIFPDVVKMANKCSLHYLHFHHHPQDEQQFPYNTNGEVRVNRTATSGDARLHLHRSPSAFNKYLSQTMPPTAFITIPPNHLHMLPLASPIQFPTSIIKVGYHISPQPPSPVVACVACSPCLHQGMVVVSSTPILSLHQGSLSTASRKYPMASNIQRGLGGLPRNGDF